MNRTFEHIYFPILIDLRRFPCLVVGGGRVALRKVLSLLEFNARVTVVSPKVCKDLMGLSMQGKIIVIRRPYSAEYIEDHGIVFSATDNPETNRIISSDCRRAGVLLNAADNPSICDFILPATFKSGYLTVSVSSQGKAPFYAKHMKRKLAGAVPPSTAEITELAAEFRKLLLSSGNPMSRNSKTKAYKAFLTTDWEKALTGEGKKDPETLLKKLARELRHA